MRLFASARQSKLQRDEVHDDAGLGPDEDSHEEQSGHSKDELMSKLEQILDVKLANLATKQCISSLHASILEQVQMIEKLEARTMMLESYINQIKRMPKQ